jgi:hypothetical protein
VVCLLLPSAEKSYLPTYYLPISSEYICEMRGRATAWVLWFTIEKRKEFSWVLFCRFESCTLSCIFGVLVISRDNLHIHLFNMFGIHQAGMSYCSGLCPCRLHHMVATSLSSNPERHNPPIKSRIHSRSCYCFLLLSLHVLLRLLSAPTTFSSLWTFLPQKFNSGSPVFKTFPRYQTQ